MKLIAIGTIIMISLFLLSFALFSISNIPNGKREDEYWDEIDKDK